MSRPLRVGVVVPSLDVPRWVERLVSDLEAAEFVTLRRVSVGPPAPKAPRPRGFALYERLDRRLFRAPEDALDPRSLAVKSPGSPDGVELDVVLLLGAVPDGEVGGARAWVATGDDELAAVFEGRTASRVAIEEPASGRVLAEATFSTCPLSLHRNRNRAAWKKRELFLRALLDLHRGREPTAKPGDPGTVASIGLGRYLARAGSAAVRRQSQWKLHREEWFLAYRRRGADRFQVVDPPPDRFYADPFVFEHEGRHHVFFEEYLRPLGRATISHFELTGDGPTPPRVVLQRDYHLSYPFVFELGGAIYMIPATERARTIELYRADPFPERWTFERTLLDDVYAVDTTVLEHDGRLWFFTNLVTGAATVNEELSLFSAESLQDAWTPHPRNPVVTDVRRARPAGGILRRGGDLVRPGQDCALRYGHAVVFNRIDVLTESEYRETPVGRIDAGWRPGAVGTHTYTTDGEYELLDGYWLRLRLPLLPKRMSRLRG